MSYEFDIFFCNSAKIFKESPPPPPPPHLKRAEYWAGFNYFFITIIQLCNYHIQMNFG